MNEAPVGRKFSSVEPESRVVTSHYPLFALYSDPLAILRGMGTGGKRGLSDSFGDERTKKASYVKAQIAMSGNVQLLLHAIVLLERVRHM